MANTIDWGQGSVNNTNDWGKGSINNQNDWGQVYSNSAYGETNIGVGGNGGGGNGGGFSPLDLSPNLWLDATDAATITEVSGDVSQWDDKSGSGNNVSQGTAIYRPSNGGAINGNNALDWGTTVNNGKGLRLSRGSNTDNWQDVYIVGRYGLTDNTFPSNAANLFNATANTGTSVGLGMNAKTDASTLGNLLWWFNKLYLNGTLITTETDVLSGANTVKNNFLLSFSSTNAIGVDGVTIGNLWTNTQDGWVGVIGEVVSFPKKLSDTERGQMNTYLANKWSL